MFDIAAYGSRGPRLSAASAIADYVVDDMAAALALTSTSVGETVYINGYASAGDGGEGYFDIDNSGDPTDGGTCFVFDEDATTVTPYTTNLSGSPHQLNDGSPRSDIIFGTFKAEYAGGSMEYVTDYFLYLPVVGADAGFNHADGQIPNNLGGWRANILAAHGVTNYTVSYSYATDTKRLKRDLSAGDYVKPEWWGAFAYDGSTDDTGKIGWAYRVAARLAASTSREWEVRHTSMYGYAGQIVQGQNTCLRGASDGIRDGQGIRVLPNTVLFESRLTKHNFISNGGLDSDADFSKGTGVTIAAGVAHWDGTQVADSDLTQDLSAIHLFEVLTEGDVYLVKYTVSNYSLGNVTAVIGNTEGADQSDNGTYYERITAGAGLDFAIRGDAAFVGDIDDIDVAWYPSSDQLRRMWIRWKINNSSMTRLVTDPYIANTLHVIDFDIDGNEANNRDWISNPNTYNRTSIGGDNAGVWLQNSGDWNGYVSVQSASYKGVGGSIAPEHILLENVHVHDFGGNCLLAQNVTHWTGSNRVKVGNSVRNHLWYQMQVDPDFTAATQQGNITGEVVDIECYGYMWSTAIILYAGHIKGITYAYGGGIANPRGNIPNHFYHLRDGATGANVSFWTADKIIEDAVMDFSGLADNPEYVSYNGDDVTLINHTVTTHAVQMQVIVVNDSSDYDGSLTINGLTVNAESDAFNGLVALSTKKYGAVDITDLSYIHPNRHDGNVITNMYFPVHIDFDAIALQTISVTNFSETVAGGSIERQRIVDNTYDTSPGESAYGGLVKFTNCDFLNTGNKGALNTPSANEKAAVEYRLDGSTFQVDTGGSEANCENTWMDWWHFDNCTASNTDRTSEDDSTITGQLTATFAGDGAVSFKDMGTNLFWIPSIATTTLDDGSSTVIGMTPIEGGVESVNWDAEEDGVKMLPRLRIHFGRVLESGETFVYDWTASVRPIP